MTAMSLAGMMAWIAASAAATVVLLVGSGLPPSFAQPPVVQPSAPPPIRQFEGTVIGVEPSARPPRLSVRTNGLVWNLFVTPSTVIVLTEAATGRGGPASLDQIRRGDLARVTMLPSGQATEIYARYREAVGRLDRVSGSYLYLIGGQVLRLADEALITLDGREVTLDRLRRGMEVTLRLHPRTGEVWEIRARPLAAPVPPPVRERLPRIGTVSISRPGPLGRGQVLEVVMRGTPGGTAWFDIEAQGRRIRMDEEPRGRYVGRYRVRPGDAVRGRVTVRLRIRGTVASKEAGTVVLDGISPRVSLHTPAPNATVMTTRPDIVVRFADRGPAGIKPQGVRVWVNGREARMKAFSSSAAIFEPSWPLPIGRISVRARVSDAAQNETVANWTFRVAHP